MANVCEYTMKVVAKDEKALDRIFSILDEKDAEYYIHPVFNWQNEEIDDCGDGKKSVFIYGDMRDDTYHWIEDEENKDDHLQIWEKNEDGTCDCSKPCKEGTAHYTTLKELAKVLNLTIELWSQSIDDEFQSHAIVDNGKVKLNRRKRWSLNYDTGRESGGYKDYNEFSI